MNKFTKFVIKTLFMAALSLILLIAFFSAGTLNIIFSLLTGVVVSYINDSNVVRDQSPSIRGMAALLVFLISFFALTYGRGHDLPQI